MPETKEAHTVTNEIGSHLDPYWRGVIRWGGLSLFAAAALLVIFVLMVFITKQTLPVPPEILLENPTFPTMLFILAAFGELLLMPGGLGLYFALKDVRKTPMFMAIGLWAVSVIMFLVSRGQIISISRMSGRYMETASEAMRAAYLASSEHAMGKESVYAIMGMILLNAASIMMGLVMLKGASFKRLGYLVIVAGIWAILAPFLVLMGLPLIIPFIGLILIAVWQMIAGIKLFRMGSAI
jgi:hypothetical protein